MGISRHRIGFPIRTLPEQPLFRQLLLQPHHPVRHQLSGPYTAWHRAAHATPHHTAGTVELCRRPLYGHPCRLHHRPHRHRDLHQLLPVRAECHPAANPDRRIRHHDVYRLFRLLFFRGLFLQEPAHVRRNTRREQTKLRHFHPAYHHLYHPLFRTHRRRIYLPFLRCRPIHLGERAYILRDLPRHLLLL